MDLFSKALESTPYKRSDDGIIVRARPVEPVYRDASNGIAQMKAAESMPLPEFWNIGDSAGWDCFVCESEMVVLGRIQDEVIIGCHHCGIEEKRPKW